MLLWSVEDVMILAYVVTQSELPLRSKQRGTEQLKRLHIEEYYAPR